MTAVQGYDPRTAAPVGEPVPASTASEVDAVVAAASRTWPDTSAADRAFALEAVADALDADRARLVEIADAETALGVPRLTGEIGRTTGQLRMFASLLRTGAHLDVVFSPGPPDVRRTRQAIGPVAVFSASNFPFAFSVAGGDTASALAAGCPVVVKAHEAHPRTSLAVAEILRRTLPEGVFALVMGREAGTALVRHPGIRAVGFTGSLAGGRALFDLAQGRPDPIPFYGELGSVNPVVVLPGAASVAEGYAASLTLGAGQFCTNPGLLFVPDDAVLLDEIAQAVRGTTAGPLLSPGIHRSYVDHTTAGPARVLATGTAGEGAWAVAPVVFATDAADFVARAESFTEETFGPSGLVVTYRDLDTLLAALEALPGSLTGSVHAGTDDSATLKVAKILRTRVGRLVHNGWPTGVAVCWAMHHGGPWPASTSPAHTSVGSAAIDRWLVPIAYQDWPEHLLPPELRTDNPLGFPRTVQG
ncbi:aldehyde dehydrogenase (NADP(+)) [Actinokineospora xionganensis]|uniref:Aldehyde dehydrogenase (NADP(+)) n=1 Tax=Actinokineospora xionganensis TaxID=2684470 RepID=A0ABR7L3S3_9PSEU|nr:aldehyde dehydrogenase (NADP(+)) [Actinokineospora xionganensis]MBC6447325.1 aldehyde dehydrogenase (NADP(+)) [Actinokineospora xionganensis]